MGRHSTGKNNYALSGGAIAAVIVALLAVIATVIFFTLRAENENSPAADGNSADPSSCVSGDLELPVAATNAEIGRTLIDAYSATAPVVRDFCVVPVLVDSVADAAVYIAPISPVALQQLEQRNRTAATADPAPVYSEDIGVAVPETSAVPGSFADVDLASVSFPVNEESAASALVASRLAATEEDAVAALTAQRVISREDAQRSNDASFATAQNRVPQGYSFVPLDEKAVYGAIALNQAETVSEDQARAGQDFARSAAENFPQDSGSQPIVPESVWAAAAATDSESLSDSVGAPAAIPANEAGMLDTLFLLDTSEPMGPFLSSAAEGISTAARAVSDNGKQIALWNYSSPLNPGVTNGYRRNVLFTEDSEIVAETVSQLFSGGQPNTREAVSAAVEYAAMMGTPTRVVVVTTGTADGAQGQGVDTGTDEAFNSALKQAEELGVSLSVLHVGPGQHDPALREAAASTSDAVGEADVAPAIQAAVV